MCGRAQLQMKSWLLKKVRLVARIADIYACEEGLRLSFSGIASSFEYVFNCAYDPTIEYGYNGKRLEIHEPIVLAAVMSTQGTPTAKNTAK